MLERIAPVDVFFNVTFSVTALPAVFFNQNVSRYFVEASDLVIVLVRVSEGCAPYAPVLPVPVYNPVIVNDALLLVSKSVNPTFDDSASFTFATGNRFLYPYSVALTERSSLLALMGML